MANQTHYEVEMKFPLGQSPTPWERLRELGFAPSEPHFEADHYYNHPSRDFGLTDEAFRIRESRGGIELTYKGPKLDPFTKTREEIELPLQVQDQTVAAARRMMEALGFRSVATVAKRRRRGELVFQGTTVTVVWDELDEIGQFLELEIVVEETRLDEARQTLITLAEQLQLGPSIRSSYLELVLTRNKARSGAASI